MSNKKYYVLCDTNCKYESLTKEQIYAAITEATGNTPTNVNDAFITNIKELHNNDNIQFWVGTEAEFNALGITATGHVMKMDADGKIYIYPGDTVNPPHANSHAPGGSDPLTMEILGVDVELERIENKVNTKAAKSSLMTKTLTAANWSGSAAPYTYNLSVAGVTSTSNQEILPGLNITAAQLEAFQGANIQDGGQSANTVVLKAFGDKPTVNIPIRVILRGDM